MSENKEAPTIKQEIRESLKNLGFTDYFINIYVALLNGGEMNAHELSEVTGVPYSRIYEVLNDMIKRTIVTKVDGRPSTFLANNPNDMLKAIKQRQETEFDLHMNECLPFLNQLFGDKSTVQNSQIVIYEGDQTCRDHFRNILMASARLLQIALKDLEDLYPVIKMTLDFLRTKGVQIHFVLEDKTKTNGFIEEMKKFGDIRFVPQIEENIVISDDRTALQGQKAHFNIAKPSESEYCVLTSTDGKYVMYLSELFNALWNHAGKSV